jgi:hypothetical protein
MLVLPVNNNSNRGNEKNIGNKNIQEKNAATIIIPQPIARFP